MSEKNANHVTHVWTVYNAAHVRFLTTRKVFIFFKSLKVENTLTEKRIQKQQQEYRYSNMQY